MNVIAHKVCHICHGLKTLKFKEAPRKYGTLFDQRKPLEEIETNCPKCNPYKVVAYKSLTDINKV